MLLSEGTKLGRYEIRSKLGAGGMGEVYLAEDTKLERKVAIKVLSPESITDSRASKRLMREAKAAAKLDHLNFAAHIRAPKLMMHGRYDENLSLKTEAEPLYKLLREPKRLVLYDGGHIPPQLELLVTTLNGWLDETLGPVKRE